MPTSERVIPVAALGSNEGIGRERAWDQSESAAPERKGAGTETHRKMSKKGRRAKSKKRASEAPRSSATGLVLHIDPEPASAPMDGALEPASASAPMAQEAEATASASLPPEAATETPPAFAADPPPPGGATLEAASTLDESFPPVEPPADAHAELDHDFFAHKAHDSVPPSVPPSLREPESTDPRLRRTHTPEAAKRRAQFAKYVKIAVGVAAGVCLLAVGKVVLLQNAPGTAAHAEEQPASFAHPGTAPSPIVSQVVAPPAPSAQTAEATEQASAVQAAASAPAEPSSVAEQPSAVASAAVPEVASAAASSAPSASSAAGGEAAPDPKEAAKLKGQAQRALDRGAFGQAIAAGEKSVGLDPTDGEAWLLLGAAYQEKGDTKNARRCYRSCIDQGKRGDKSECAAMLR
jgi:hypothetical protein